MSDDFSTVVLKISRLLLEARHRFEHTTVSPKAMVRMGLSLDYDRDTGQLTQ